MSTPDENSFKTISCSMDCNIKAVGVAQLVLPLAVIIALTVLSWNPEKHLLTFRFCGKDGDTNDKNNPRV